MLKKLSTLTLVVVLISTFSHAKAASTDEAKPKATEINSTTTVANIEAKPNEKLSTDILKLVADTKAGKVASAPKPQTQPRNVNNLSKGTKIAIGVVIVVAVVATIFVVKAHSEIKAPTGPLF
jgi:hypothetical protein